MNRSDNRIKMNPKKIFPNFIYHTKNTIPAPSKGFFLSLLVAIISFQCQHARIRVAPPVPEECKPWEDKKEEEVCKNKWDELIQKRDSIPVVEKEFEHEYYYWGLKPGDIGVRLDKECPKGVAEIHQYSTFKQGLYEQVTVGFYSPRTLRLVCLSQPLETEPARRQPARRRR